MLVTIPDYGLIYWFGTANPFNRIPVFMMGIFAGIIRVEGKFKLNPLI